MGKTDNISYYLTVKGFFMNFKTDKVDYEFKTEPFDHQRTALERSWREKSHALFMEMGTGKTKVAIDNMAVLHETGLVDAVLNNCTEGRVR